MVILRIAQEKKPHNIAKKLIIHCCKDIIRCVGGWDAEKVALIRHSNNTVHRRIVDMSNDLKQQVIADLKKAPFRKFAIQLDESTYVTACAQLLMFVRYVSGEDFKEDFLFCRTLDFTTRGEDIFVKVSNFFGREGLSWNNVVHAQLTEHHRCLAVDQGFEEK